MSISHVAKYWVVRDSSGRMLAAFKSMRALIEYVRAKQAVLCMV